MEAKRLAWSLGWMTNSAPRPLPSKRREETTEQGEKVKLREERQQAAAAVDTYTRLRRVAPVVAGQASAGERSEVVHALLMLAHTHAQRLQCRAFIDISKTKAS